MSRHILNVLRRIVPQPLVRGLLRVLVRIEDPKAIWRRGTADELEWWRYCWIEPGGGGEHYKQDFLARFKPDMQLDEMVARHLPSDKKHRPIKILDVGAGPITALGFKKSGYQIEVTAIDALADKYNELLSEAGLTPPLKTRQLEAEQISANFAADSFDIVYARNSLDHTYDPASAIEQMVDVVRPGGYVLLRHYENEGTNEAFNGLHLWDFTVAQGNFMVFGTNRKKGTNVTHNLAERATVEVTRTADNNVVWLDVMIKKHA